MFDTTLTAATPFRMVEAAMLEIERATDGFRRIHPHAVPFTSEATDWIHRRKLSFFSLGRLSSISPPHVLPEG